MEALAASLAESEFVMIAKTSLPACMKISKLHVVLTCIPGGPVGCGPVAPYRHGTADPCATVFTVSPSRLLVGRSTSSMRSRNRSTWPY
jgi:hypothetical protein